MLQGREQEEPGSSHRLRLFLTVMTGLAHKLFLCLVPRRESGDSTPTLSPVYERAHEGGRGELPARAAVELRPLSHLWPVSKIGRSASHFENTFWKGLISKCTSPADQTD